MYFLIQPFLNLHISHFNQIQMTVKQRFYALEFHQKGRNINIKKVLQHVKWFLLNLGTNYLTPRYYCPLTFFFKYRKLSILSKMKSNMNHL